MSHVWFVGTTDRAHPTIGALALARQPAAWGCGTSPGDSSHRLPADAFYRIIATRYERRSIIITSNKSFESWAEVFLDAVIASAVLDRLVHHAHLVPIVGESPTG